MLEWILVGVGYAVGLLLFQLLGGIGAAGRAIERWGRESSRRRLAERGLDLAEPTRSGPGPADAEPLAAGPSGPVRSGGVRGPTADHPPPRA